MSQKVKIIVEEARKQLENARAYQKRYYDAHHRHQEFQVGNILLLSTRNLHLPGTRKSHPRWMGPFKVLQRIGPVAYKLDLEGRFSSLYPTFHTSYLKPHQLGGASGAPPEPVKLDG